MLSMSRNCKSYTFNIKFRLNTSFDLLTYFWFSFWSLNYKMSQIGPLCLLPFTVLVLSVSFFMSNIFNMIITVWSQIHGILQWTTHIWFFSSLLLLPSSVKKNKYRTTTTNWIWTPPSFFFSLSIWILSLYSFLFLSFSAKLCWINYLINQL